MLADLPFNKTTGAIIESAIDVHRQLGPGLLESSYSQCLQYELQQRGLRFETQRAVPLRYKDIALATSYRIDLIVEREIVIEVKAVDRLMSIHEAQLPTYLRLIDAPAGLLINFNVPRLMDGVKRLLNSRHIGSAGKSHV